LRRDVGCDLNATVAYGTEAWKSRYIHLRSKTAFIKTIGQTRELEVAKQAVESSVRLRKMSVKTLWRSWPPPKRKMDY
jgi:hypothetical protein